MKLHELPQWNPAEEPEEKPVEACVISVEEIEDDDEADDEDEMDEACKLLRTVYTIFSHIMMLDSIYHTLDRAEQDQIVETALSIYQFLEEWDSERGTPEEHESATDFDFVDMAGG